jgi:signal transduction histidine kinase
VPRLSVTRGPDQGKLFELTAEQVTVGRDSSNRVRLLDTEVSRRHAEFVRTADGYRLRDLNSANGTFVNDQSIRDVLLRPGDTVQVGQTVLLFSAAADELPAADLASRINLLARQDVNLSAAIIRTVGEAQGSRLLTHPEKAESPWLRSNLGVIYESIQAVSQILDVEQLLERLMDLSFRVLAADRGCIMLRSESDQHGPEAAPLDVGAFEPKALRWRDPAQRQEKMPVSRTIMEHVLREKQGVLVADAARDQRFQAVQSIVRLGVREIICVPMKGRHETLGVLYLDSLTPNRDEGKFSTDHLNLAIAIAHQAALAVEDTRYYQAMMQAERLAAVGQTVAALSHHIKNILNGLKFGGDMLRKGIDEKDDGYLKHGWRLVEANQGKIYDLVMDMLSYSKEREPNVARVDLNTVLQEVVELLGPNARERGIALHGKPAATLPACLADREAIHRALLNLAGNALDAAEGGEVPVVVVSSSVEGDGEWLRLSVADNGTGIEPEKMRELFRPFISTKGARGTGLGLAVSRKILREHGGDILVESTLGQGSTFTMRLPLRGPGAPEEGTMTHNPPRPPEAD